MQSNLPPPTQSMIKSLIAQQRAAHERERQSRPSKDDPSILEGVASLPHRITSTERGQYSPAAPSLPAIDTERRPPSSELREDDVATKMFDDVDSFDFDVGELCSLSRIGGDLPISGFPSTRNDQIHERKPSISDSISTRNDQIHERKSSYSDILSLLNYELSTVDDFISMCREDDERAATPSAEVPYTVHLSGSLFFDQGLVNTDNREFFRQGGLVNLCTSAGNASTAGQEDTDKFHGEDVDGVDDNRSAVTEASLKSQLWDWFNRDESTAKRAEMEAYTQQQRAANMEQEAAQARKTLDAQTQIEMQRLKYQDQLERKRQVDMLNAEKYMQEEQLKKQEEMMAQQEEMRRKTLCNADTEVNSTTNNESNLHVNETRAAAPNVQVPYTDNDVLFGQGGLVNKHPGNRRFRSLADDFRQPYNATSSREEKRQLVEHFVASFVKANGACFWSKDGNGTYVEVNVNNKFYANKFKQLIREEPGEARKKAKQRAIRRAEKKLSSQGA